MVEQRAGMPTSSVTASVRARTTSSAPHIPSALPPPALLHHLAPFDVSVRSSPPLYSSRPARLSLYTSLVNCTVEAALVLTREQQTTLSTHSRHPPVALSWSLRLERRGSAGLLGGTAHVVILTTAMSELFESLNFPLQPNSSPSAGECDPASNRAVRRDAEGEAWRLPNPRTPRIKAASAAARAGSNDRQQHRQDQHRSQANTSATTLASPSSMTSTSPSAGLLARPGRVFWHATPSPSQQIRQQEFQSYLSKTSPVLPLGSQAFREELLQQTHQQGGGSSAATMTDTFERSGTDVGSARAAITLGSAMASSSGRKFSRRSSRRSAGGTDGKAGERSQGGGQEGMQQMLADLKRHLTRQGNQVDDADVCMVGEQALRCPTRQEQIPSKNMLQSFSQQGPSTAASSSSGCIAPMSAPPVEAPSNSRDWNRTKSLPIAMPVPPHHRRQTLVSKANSEQNVPSRPSAHQWEQRGSSGVDLPSKPLPCVGRTPTQTILLPARENGMAKGPETDKEESHKASVCKSEGTETRKIKTRSSSSSVSPPKKSMMTRTRTARVGLSRHIGAFDPVDTLPHQHGLHHLTGPAAPFKQPSRMSTSVAATAPSLARHKTVVGQRSKEVIVIDDSDEEVETKQTHPRSNSTSPRKDTPAVLPTPIHNMSGTAADADTSFDTSMDDVMLVDAVEQAEAAILASQREQQLIGLDSLGMASGANEALVIAMETDR